VVEWFTQPLLVTGWNKCNVQNFLCFLQCEGVEVIVNCCQSLQDSSCCVQGKCLAILNFLYVMQCHTTFVFCAGREKMKWGEEENINLCECLVIYNSKFECMEGNGNMLFPLSTVHSLHDVDKMNIYRADHVSLTVFLHDSTWEPLDGFWLNLVWILWHLGLL
jgi:hypothetical protein